MKNNWFKKIFLIAGFASAFVITQAQSQEKSQAKQSEKLKIGFIYVGPVGDFGWSYQHDQARKAIEEKFGDKIETTYVESVKEGADTERVISQLVASGCKMIFSTSFGFMNATLKASKQYPNVKFEHATGYKRANNVSTYMARDYEARYIVGMLAGAQSKTNMIGFVGSYPIPEVIRNINATMLGARAINPKIKLKVVWTNSWYDPAKETEAAKSLINDGIDVLMQHLDSPAVPQAAEEAGVWAMGSTTDISQFAPKKLLTSIVLNWTPYYTDRIQDVLDNKWKSKNTWDGFSTDMVQLTKFNDAINLEVVEKINQVKANMISGEFNPFTGPMKNRNNVEVAKQGEVLSDEALLQMNYFVDGVEGDLPK